MLELVTDTFWIFFWFSLIQALSLLVKAVSLAAIAAGADGLIIESHTHPEAAWSDGSQSLKPAKLQDLIHEGRKVANAVGRDI